MLKKCSNFPHCTFCLHFRKHYCYSRKQNWTTIFGGRTRQLYMGVLWEFTTQTRIQSPGSACTHLLISESKNARHCFNYTITIRIPIRESDKFKLVYDQQTWQRSTSQCFILIYQSPRPSGFRDDVV